MSEEPSLRSRALRFLARREYSRKELAARLAPHAESAGELQAVLDALNAKGQLSDERYAESRVHTLSKKYGTARILHELKSKGVEASVAEEAAREARSTDLERARIALQRKFREPAASREERARRMRFLQSRGFSIDVIRALMSSKEEDG